MPVNSFLCTYIVRINTENVYSYRCCHSDVSAKEYTDGIWHDLEGGHNLEDASYRYIFCAFAKPIYSSLSTWLPMVSDEF